MFVFHFDSSHGWLAVPMHKLKATGFTPSEYSYRSLDNETAYLEEDRDLPGFAKAFKDLTGKGISDDISNQDDGANSFIRKLPRFPK
jgi:hypothetical protein